VADLPEPAVRQAIRQKILRWYDRHKRELPWRGRAGDGYAQWVAEIMLQQTQVETVIPYYERFMARFPDVKSLAAATGDDLLRYWQGLGYYRRAANLHEAAKRIAADGGVVPDSVESLLELPGIGRYTAGAIASMAFDRRAAAVDGNVARVLARLFHITDEIGRPATMRRMWALAECLLPVKRCGDFNQALMDLGATVCVPGEPRCERCPLRSHCRACAAADAADLPSSARRPAVPEAHYVVAVIRRRERYLMMKRPPRGLWAGLWEFPNRPHPPTRPSVHAIRRLLKELACDRGIAQFAGRHSHRLTHRLVNFDVYLVECSSRTRAIAGGTNVRWTRLEHPNAVPISTAARRILRVALNCNISSSTKR
jgi:A/G-specific adenine glycosylase